MGALDPTITVLRCWLLGQPEVVSHAQMSEPGDIRAGQISHAGNTLGTVPCMGPGKDICPPLEGGSHSSAFGILGL
jgi:hypothetical protein